MSAWCFGPAALYERVKEVDGAPSSPAPQDPQGVPGQTGQIGPGQGDDTAYAALGGCGLARSRSALTGR